MESLRGLPENLVVLNLSGCGLRSLEGVERCANLRLLNANNNEIARVTVMEKLSELYIAKNQIVSLEQFASFPRLKLLDVSYNPVAALDVRSGTTVPVSILSITGTPLAVQSNAEELLRSLMPTLAVLNPASLASHSFYRSITAFVHETPPKPKPAQSESVSLSISAPQSRGHSRYPSASVQAPVQTTTAKPHEIVITSKPHQKRLSNVIEAVLAKRFFVVNPKNIQESMRRSGDFGNPIAAMMIGPASVDGYSAPKARERGRSVIKLRLAMNKENGQSWKVSRNRIRRSMTGSVAPSSCSASNNTTMTQPKQRAISRSTYSSAFVGRRKQENGTVTASTIAKIIKDIRIPAGEKSARQRQSASVSRRKSTDHVLNETPRENRPRDEITQVRMKKNEIGGYSSCMSRRGNKAVSFGMCFC